MARTKIQIDKSQLAKIITDLENQRTFRTRQQLTEAVVEQLPMSVSPAWVTLRIKEFNIEPKTPKGKRGRAAGTKLSSGQKAAMQAGRKTRSVTNVVELQEYFPESRQGLVNKIAKGSLAACVKAKCLECCNFDTKEIKHCEIKTCPLWSFRPYQEK